MKLPILDGSEMIGEETVDEYLARLVKEVLFHIGPIPPVPQNDKG